MCCNTVFLFVTGPLVRLFDVETSHKIGILAAKMGFFPKETRPDPACLRTTVWGREFPNPLGKHMSQPAGSSGGKAIAGERVHTPWWHGAAWQSMAHHGTAWHSMVPWNAVCIHAGMAALNQRMLLST